MTDAERQARHRTAKLGAAKHGAPVIRFRRPPDRCGRAQRWNDTVAGSPSSRLSMPCGWKPFPTINTTATAEALRAIAELNLIELQAIEPPRGFGRD
jgi:hypothetical protein